MKTFNNGFVYFLMAFVGYLYAELHQPLHLCTKDEEFNHQNVCQSGSHQHFQCHGGAMPKDMSHVRILSLCNFPESSFNGSILDDARKLRSFALMYSNISEINEQFSTNLNNLQVLILSHLKMITVHTKTFRELNALKFLDLRANQLTSFNESFLNNLTSIESLYISDNPYTCTSETIRNYQWLVNNSQIKDASQVNCGNSIGNLYPGKPILAILNFLKSIEHGCPEKCTCDMPNVVWGPDKKALVPLITVNCKKQGLTELPPILPINTTTLHVEGNKISNLRPLSENPFYFNLADLYLDNNLIHSIVQLEGTYWLNNFRVLSLKGNQLQQVPTYALDNAFQKNRNAVRLYFSNNPWICDCQFTPSFQDLLVKYQTLVNDIDDILCAFDGNDENSYMPIRTLSVSAVCRLPSDFHVDSVDILNIVLASLIVLVLGKLAYDYYSFKKTGKLPWIVTKIP